MQLATFHHPTSHCNIPGVLGHSVNFKILKTFLQCRRLVFPDYFSVSCNCSKNEHQEGFYNSYTHGNIFHALSVNEDSQNNTEDLQVRSDHVKHYILATIKIKNIGPENLSEIGLLIGSSARKKLPVIVILEHSTVKEVKKWELSGENNKDVTKHFSGATTDNMKLYIRSPHYQIIQSLLSCGTNDWRQNTSAVETEQRILEFNFKFQSDSNNILISGFVPLRDKSNAKAA